jgi:hypothetical protein
MLPAVASNVAFIPPQQAPLVNTVILGSEVTRVPSFNVAPSVSNAQVDNNTKGNSNSFARTNTPDISDSDTDKSFSLPSAVRPAPFIALPTSFLAQLLGQSVGDADLATQGILVEYEKLVAISNVKYKPSNALKPLPDLSGVFGSLLSQPDDTAVVTQDVQQPQAAPATNTQISESLQTVPTITTPPQAPVDSISLPLATTQQAEPLTRNSPPASPGVSAYIASGQRNDTIGRSNAADTDSVSDLA